MANQPRQAVVRHVNALAGQPQRPETSDQELLKRFTERRGSTGIGTIGIRPPSEHALPMVASELRPLLSPEGWCDAATHVSWDGLGRCKRFPLVRSPAR